MKRSKVIECLAVRIMQWENPLSAHLIATDRYKVIAERILDFLYDEMDILDQEVKMKPGDEDGSSPP